MSAPRITYPAACVLQSLARGCGYGFDIMDVTGLPSGTVYPMLRRFEAQGLVASDWEDEQEAHRAGRPRRRNYRLTAKGQQALERASDRFTLHRRLFAAERP